MFQLFSNSFSIANFVNKQMYCGVKKKILISWDYKKKKSIIQIWKIKLQTKQKSLKRKKKNNLKDIIVYNKIELKLLLQQKKDYLILTSKIIPKIIL